MAKKALITGITGQDGSYLAELLLSKDYEVHGVIRRASTFNTGRLEHLYQDPHERDAKLVLHYGDLTDGQSLTNLILDIFAKRARTAQAKTQVELAQYQYLLPRLTRMWTHLEKQRGGIGLRGPGESEIETDRRAIRNKLSKLKEKLRDIEKQSSTQRYHSQSTSQTSSPAPKKTTHCSPNLRPC